jgi:hypothetical protein
MQVGSQKKKKKVFKNFLLHKNQVGLNIFNSHNKRPKFNKNGQVFIHGACK